MKIRTLALALIKNQSNQYFFHQAFDSVKNEKFYRPLGGGVDFGEYGVDALKREFHEEISEEIKVKELLGVFENIFTFEAKKGHEIILMFEAIFLNPDNYSKDFDINESGRVVGKAVWKSLEEIKAENAKLYPLGIESYM